MKDYQYMRMVLRAVQEVERLYDVAEGYGFGMLYNEAEQAMNKAFGMLPQECWVR